MSCVSDAQVTELVEHFRLEAEDHGEYTLISVPDRRRRGRRKREKWTRKKAIGQGSFGVVWLESRVEEGSQSSAEVRAVKQVVKGLTSPQSFGINCARELYAMARLMRHSDYFADFFGWFETEENVYFSMEYFPHGDLGICVKSPLCETEVQNLASQLLAGLKIVHQYGITHRDLKPSNVFVKNQNPWWVKIGDFGISKRIGQSTYLRTVTGTTHFMAPEIADGDPEEVYTNSVDLWSLGCVLYFILTIKLPFANKRSLDLYLAGTDSFPKNDLQKQGVSSTAVNFIQKLLAAKPGERPSAELAAQSEWLDDLQDDASASEAEEDKPGEHYILEACTTTPNNHHASEEAVISDDEPEVDTSKVLDDTSSNIQSDAVVNAEPTQHTSSIVQEEPAARSKSQVPLSPSKPSLFVTQEENIVHSKPQASLSSSRPSLFVAQEEPVARSKPRVPRSSSRPSLFVAQEEPAARSKPQVPRSPGKLRLLDFMLSDALKYFDDLQFTKVYRLLLSLCSIRYNTNVPEGHLLLRKALESEHRLATHVCRLLLYTETSPAVKDVEGILPIYRAIRNHDSQKACLLLDAGADAQLELITSTQGWMREIWLWNDQAVTDNLLQRRWIHNFLSPKDRGYLIELAACEIEFHSRTGYVKYYPAHLFAQSTGLDMKDSTGRAAIHYAAIQNNVEMLNRLIEYGADTKLQTDKGISTIELARDAGNFEVVEILNRLHAYGILNISSLASMTAVCRDDRVMLRSKEMAGERNYNDYDSLRGLEGDIYWDESGGDDPGPSSNERTDKQRHKVRFSEADIDIDTILKRKQNADYRVELQKNDDSMNGRHTSPPSNLRPPVPALPTRHSFEVAQSVVRDDGYEPATTRVVWDFQKPEIERHVSYGDRPIHARRINIEDQYDEYRTAKRPTRQRKPSSGAQYQ